MPPIEIRKVIREVEQHMGIILIQPPRPEMFRGEKVIAEAFKDSVTEGQGDTSIEETAQIIAAIAKREPTNNDINRNEIKSLQQESPEIRAAVNALELNDKEAIRRTWEKTHPKQRNPTQQFLIRHLEELTMDGGLLVVT